MPSHSIPARALIFLAAMGFIIVTPTPFVSLSEADAKDAASGGGLSIVFLIIGLIMVTAIAAVCRQDRPALRALRRWPYLALAACIVVFSVASIDPLISIRRGILALSIIATAAAMPLLPRGRSQLALLLAAPAGLAIALSYFGVLFLPELDPSGIRHHRDFRNGGRRLFLLAKEPSRNPELRHVHVHRLFRPSHRTADPGRPAARRLACVPLFHPRQDLGIDLVAGLPVAAHSVFPPLGALRSRH